MYTIFHCQSQNSTMYTIFPGNHKKALCTQSSMATTKQHYVYNLPWQAQNSICTQSSMATTKQNYTHSIFSGIHKTALCTQSSMATTKEHYVDNLPWQPQNSIMYTIFHGNHKTAPCTDNLPWQPQNSTMYTIFHGNHNTALCKQSFVATTKSISSLYQLIKLTWALKNLAFALLCLHGARETQKLILELQ